MSVMAFTGVRSQHASIMALAHSTQAKILVVDDDELELALVCDRLQSCGLDVRQAANGAQGLEDTYVIMLTVLDSGFASPVTRGT